MLGWYITEPMIRLAPNKMFAGSIGIGVPADDVADLDEGAAGAEVLNALLHELRTPDKLHDHVGAAAIGQLFDALNAHLGCRPLLLDVDRVIGAELARQLQAVLQAVEHDHAMRSHVLGRGDRVEP